MTVFAIVISDSNTTSGSKDNQTSDNYVLKHRNKEMFTFPSLVCRYHKSFLWNDALLYWEAVYPMNTRIKLIIIEYKVFEKQDMQSVIAIVC